ncbi:DNA replication/checkpoint protein [Aspergillus oleicola]
MATTAPLEIATHATALRAELKEWERAFAAANEGRKAGRGDIKNNPGIAAKYKEYSRLKAQESSTNNPEKSKSRPIDANEHERSKKRKHSSPNGPQQGYTQTTSTPRKQSSNIFQTPSKTRTPSHPVDVDPYDSPSILRRLFSPSTHLHQQSSSPLKTAIGPTPQRDGKALGLFDLLSESGGSTATPSANRIASIKGMDAVTPSKKRKTMDTIVEEDEEGDGEEDEEEMGRGERTPASSGKRFMLSALFATPTAWRYSSIVEDEQRGNGEGAGKQMQSPLRTGTESNNDASNPNLETPIFLRRSTSNLNNMSNTTGLSPIPVRKPPFFPGRGLSQIVQGLRDMEEERMEDELDVLREMENETVNPGGDVDVPDSQMGGEANTRTFKKRGQKRTTRLVKMRPVIAPRPSATRSQSQSQSQTKHQSRPQSQQAPSTRVTENVTDEEDYGDDDDLLAIVETQIGAATRAAGKDENEDNGWDSQSLHSISEAESEPDSDGDPDYGDMKPKRLSLGRSKSFSEKMKEAIGDTPGTKQTIKPEKEKTAEKENKKAPAPRKINPNAHSHANYRSLKIRRGGRAGGRGFGRFRRR